MNNKLQNRKNKQKKRMPPLEQLKNVFKLYPAIQAVYLFGSYANGNPHAESDLDLAIVPDGPQVRPQKLAILTELARIGFCDVDLVFLDTEDIVLKYEAIRKNKIVYARPDFDRGSLYSKIIRQYLDFLPYLKIQRDYLKRRILEGKTKNNLQN